MFTRVWEYDVAGAAVEAFRAAYGPDGDWARLFRSGPGYVATELYVSTISPLRFVTVDRWREEADWLAFRDEHGAGYERLDVRLAALTTGQRLLAEASVPDDAPS